MVQRRGEETDELRAISAQNTERYDGNQVQKVDDQVLPCDGISRRGTREFHQVEV